VLVVDGYADVAHGFVLMLTLWAVRLKSLFKDRKSTAHNRKLIAHLQAPFIPCWATP